MCDLNALEDHLRVVMPKLAGPWVKVKNGYERSLAETLGMEFSQCRYWDARWNGCLLEFKKGKNIWLDLVRYSEALLRHNEAAVMKTHTLFFLPDRQGSCVEEIVCVESASLIPFLGLSDETVARIVLSIKEQVPHSLNAQANVTWKDVRDLQRFSVRLNPAKSPARK